MIFFSYLQFRQFIPRSYEELVEIPQTYLLVKAVGRLHALLLHLILSFDSSWLLLVLQLNTSRKKLILTQKHTNLSPTNRIRLKTD